MSKNGKVEISYLIMVFIIFEKVCRKYICFLLEKEVTYFNAFGQKFVIRAQVSNMVPRL